MIAMHPHRLKQKKPFLLLEVLIALSLISMLCLFLFSFLKQNLQVEKRMDQARHLILERQNLQTRIQDLVMSVKADTDAYPLYTQVFPKENFPSLILSFDHGIDPDPLFSGGLIGRIYIDENHNLCLVLWPNHPDKKHYWRKEVLLSNISDFAIEFLKEPLETNTKNKPSFWDTSWPKTKKLPCILRMTVKQNGQTLQFAFLLPTSYPIPT